MSTRYFENYKREDTVNLETGEVVKQVVSTTEIFRKTEGEGNFIKLYIEDLGKLHKLQHKTMMVLFELIKGMDYNNEISVSIGKKKDICRYLDIYNLINGEKKLATNVIDQHITKLVKERFLYRKDKGMYIVNARLFGKGKWQDIKAIRMRVEYAELERKIETEIDKP